MAATARVARISHRTVIAVAAVSAATLTFAPSWGAGRTAQSESFFASGNASAHWDNSQSNDSDAFSQEYEVNDATSYAGTTLHHVEGLSAPAKSPSFDFKADRSGPSGGGPRLVMVFSDPATGQSVGDIELTPDTWSQDWQHMDDGSWSVHGGTCGFTYHDQYDHAVSCMGTGTVVSSAFIVTDVGFLYPTGYKNWVDNVQYDSKTLSQPSDNNNSSH
jgi:hypothetical protein